ncbi:MAG: hypothetical protein U9Q81_01350 [Pseudomonadota bacterium]|nr:hypothetical protein [Pseudomonadota bacterium]
MSTLFSYAHLQVPDDWTPEEALTVYEWINQMAEAIWDRYEVDLLPLVTPEPSADDSTQPDLFDPDDQLPF